MIESCVAPRSERTARSRAAAPTFPGGPREIHDGQWCISFSQSWAQTILPFAPMKQCG